MNMNENKPQTQIQNCFYNYIILLLKKNRIELEFVINVGIQYTPTLYHKIGYL